MRKNIIFAAIVALLAAVAVPSRAEEPEDDSKMNLNAIARSIELYCNVYKELNFNYVDTIDNKKAAETAINAMLREIDPYTEFIPDRETEAFFTHSSGEYGGIGSIIMAAPDGGVLISSPYEGSPAAKSGLKAGDKILKIDDDTVATWSTDKVSARLKGLPDTKIKVTVKRPWTDDSILTFDIVREKIFVSSVPYYGVLKGNIGVIVIDSFKEKTPQEVRAALEALKKNPAVKYIVLDLRGNGGGLLDSAVQVVGMFVPKGTEVLTTRGREKKSEKIYKTTQNPIDTEIPLAVFIDGGTASASEIVSGALQDLDRAVILGARSFGKGLVQTTIPIAENDGMLKVTTAKYYIPSGRLIQAIDYSHRNVDGSVERIPDSLTTVFKTRNGREVRDGGGITPDVKIDYPKYNQLLYNISNGNWIFNFATRFAAEHPTIAAPEDFVITDEIFEQFKASIDPEKLDYDKVCEVSLSNFKEIVKTQGYDNDSTAIIFAQLERLLKHDLNKDIDLNRVEISRALESEILSRYYYQRGESVAYLKNDNTLDKAAEIFNTEGEWERMLNPEAKRKSKVVTGPSSKVPRRLLKK